MRILTSLTASAAAALGVLIVQPLAGAATVPQVTTAAKATAAVAVPSVTVPKVATPAITTPAVTAPAVTVPSVTVPSVTTPPVTAPAVKAPTLATVKAPVPPTVTARAVQAPILPTKAPAPPTVSAPAIRTPAVTAPRVAHTPSSPAVSSVAPAVSGSRPTSASGASSASATGPAPSGSATTGSGSSSAPNGFATRTRAAPTDPSSSAAGAHGSRSGAATRSGELSRLLGSTGAVYSRRLRAMVTQLRGCLGSLPSTSARLLSLRAGIDGPARSATAAAHLLHLRAAGERRLERRSLIALTTAAGTGCAGPAAAAGAPGAAAVAGVAGVAGGARGTAAGGGGSTPTSPGSAATAAPGASATGAATVPTAAAAEKHGSVPTVRLRGSHAINRADAGPGGPSMFLILTVAAVLVALCLLALPEIRDALSAAAGPDAQAPSEDMMAAMATAPAATAFAEDPAYRDDTEWATTDWTDTGAAEWPEDEPGPADWTEAEPGYADWTEDEPGPVAPADPTASEPVSASGAPANASWLRGHAGHAAVLATVIGGGLARFVARGRPGSRGR